MPLIETKGAASAQGFGEFAQAGTVANYIEDVFSTWLYTGNNTTNVISNGINLSGKGGLIWTKVRNDTDPHALVDTVRGFNYIQSNSTSAQGSTGTAFSSFDSTGYTLGVDSISSVNQNPKSYVSWTFRKQPKFFDVVTYTGNGVNGRAIPHNLGATPACMFIKQTSSAQSWRVYHAGMTNPTDTLMVLNSTAAETPQGTTVFGVSSTNINVYYDMNTNGATYVAYLFASNAGGFGLTGTDNVISCGSFTTDGSGNATVSLGYEPQWVLYKKTSSGAEDWYLFDNMRGIPTGSADAQLNPNLSAAEASSFNYINLSATGFDVLNQSSSATYIYIAIRRGPMKVPTSGTSVFSPQAVNGSTAFTTNFPVDLAMFGIKAGSVDNFMTFDRQRGSLAYLKTTSTAAEGTTTSTYETVFDNNTGSNYKWWSNTSALAGWNFQRAPSFFDVVCYTGTGSATTVAHNLGVVPELMIVKMRNSTNNWTVYSSFVGNTKRLVLNGDTAASTASSTYWNDTTPTSSVFTVGTSTSTNGSSSTYVAYLFASCPGVSKVGSYTGTGTTLQVDCGFTGGARFVLIKRTDSTGDWYVYDTARGMTVLTDPYLLLNSTAAESATLGSVTTVSTGFAVNASILAAINTNGASYIFLAIA